MQLYVACYGRRGKVISRRKKSCLFSSISPSGGSLSSEWVASESAKGEESRGEAVRDLGDRVKRQSESWGAEWELEGSESAVRQSGRQ